MEKGIFVGSFDPITNGHLHLIHRASQLCGELIVIVSDNPLKKYTFTLEERMRLVHEATKEVKNVVVMAQSGGMTVQAARKLGARVLIRGMRSSDDFELEATLSYHNHEQDASIETIVLVSHPQFRFISSSMVKEIAKYGGDFSELVPAVVVQPLLAVYEEEPTRLLQLKEE